MTLTSRQTEQPIYIPFLIRYLNYFLNLFHMVYFGTRSLRLCDLRSCLMFCSIGWVSTNEKCLGITCDNWQVRQGTMKVRFSNTERTCAHILNLPLLFPCALTSMIYQKIVLICKMTANSDKYGTLGKYTLLDRTKKWCQENMIALKISASRSRLIHNHCDLITFRVNSKVIAYILEVSRATYIIC